MRVDHPQLCISCPMEFAAVYGNGHVAIGCNESDATMCWYHNEQEIRQRIASKPRMRKIPALNEWFVSFEVDGLRCYAIGVSPSDTLSKYCSLYRASKENPR